MAVNERRGGGPVARAREALADDRSRPVLAVVMALITVLATAVAFLQQDASIRSNTANREAERIGLEAVGYDVGMIVESSTDYGVFRRWFEQLERQAWAAAQAETATDGEERELLDALAAIDSELADWSTGQSRLLQPPYYDPETFQSDFAAYNAELAVGPQILARQQHDAQLAVGSAWQSRALSYVTILTILAAALFFLGLATTLRGTARPIFAATGALFAIVSLGWTVVSAATPIDRVPDAAMEGVRDAYVAVAQFQSTAAATSAEPDRELFERAMASVDAAVAADPGYADAYLARAETRTFFGDRLYFSDDGSAEEAAEHLAAAVDDFARYIESEPDDYSAWWNMGWAQLLAGRTEDALSSTDRALELSPNHFALYINRGLANLRLGDVESAEADLETAIDVVAESNLDSDAAFFSQADFNIGRLVERWPDQAEDLTTMQRRLREGQVSLAAFGEPEPRADAPEIADMEITALSLSTEGELLEEESLDDGEPLAGADRVGVRLHLTVDGADAGMPVSVRVWRNDTLDQSSSVDVPWTEDADGDGMTIDIVSPYGRADFPLDPGLYELEVYLDGATRGATSWEVTAV